MTISQNQIRLLIKVLLTTLAVLLIPLVLTLTISDFNWDVFDFVVGGMLIFSFGIFLTMLWKAKKSRRQKHLFFWIGIVVLLLIWMELAVGIFGTPFSGN